MVDGGIFQRLAALASSRLRFTDPIDPLRRTLPVPNSQCSLYAVPGKADCISDRLLVRIVGRRSNRVVSLPAPLEPVS